MKCPECGSDKLKELYIFCEIWCKDCGHIIITKEERKQDDKSK